MGLYKGWSPNRQHAFIYTNDDPVRRLIYAALYGYVLNFAISHSVAIFTRGQFWPSGIVIACVCGSVCVYQSRACPHENSSPIQARITKFGPEMQNTLVWVPIVFEDDRPWSSRSNWTWKSNFTSFWACSHHYSSAIQARITKFGPKMHLSTVKNPTNFGLDWLWSSFSFSILKPIFLPNLFAPFLYIFSETRRL